MAPTPHPVPLSAGATYVPGTPIEALLAPRDRVQALPGFDAVYSDFVDYIIRCTHRIWEEKNLGLIHTHYTPGCVVHTLGGRTVGAEEVVRNTARTLAAFPDRTLFGDHVIWSGDGAGGFYSSHRITSLMTNAGESEFGPATGRRVRVTTIADCAVRENRIYEEWLARDNSFIVRQLGFDPVAIASTQAARPPQPEHEEWRLAEIARVTAYRPAPATATPDPEADPAAFARALFDTVWNGRQFGAVRALYAPNARAEVPGGRGLFGHGEIAGWAVALLAAFPDARLSFDHVCAVPCPTGGVDIAVRWCLAGTHGGDGLYGPPTGRKALILGMTHWDVRGGRIRREWTVFDELAVLRQLVGGAA